MKQIVFDVVRQYNFSDAGSIKLFSDFNVAVEYIENEIRNDENQQREYIKVSDTSWGIDDHYGLIEGWYINKREMD